MNDLVSIESRIVILGPSREFGWDPSGEVQPNLLLFSVNSVCIGIIELVS